MDNAKEDLRIDFTITGDSAYMLDYLKTYILEQGLDKRSANYNTIVAAAIKVLFGMVACKQFDGEM